MLWVWEMSWAFNSRSILRCYLMGKHKKKKTWIYFGNGVKCPQQCHNDSLFAAYVSSFITVRWIRDFVFFFSCINAGSLCTHGGEEFCLRSQYGSGVGVCIIICFSALAFGNWYMEGERDKVASVMCKIELGRRGEKEGEQWVRDRETGKQ